MAKLEKLLGMKFEAVAAIEIFRKGTEEEFYNDPRTVYSLSGFNKLPRVKAIAENDKFFWYVCPMCKQIHIESKRKLNVDQKILRTNCEYRNGIFQDFILDEYKSQIALLEVSDSELEREWIFMQDFEK